MYRLSKVKRRVLGGVLGLWACFLAFPSYAEPSLSATARVPISDPIYRVIDQFLAFGLIDTPIYGVRPWSVKEIQSRLDDAAENKGDPLSPDESARVAELWRTVDDYYARYGHLDGDTPRYSVSFLRNADIDFLYTNVDPHSFPKGTNEGALPVQVEPLSENRAGRAATRGAQYFLRTEHEFQLSPYLSGHFSPYYYFQFPNSELSEGGTRIDVSPHELYLRLVAANVALQVGRSALHLGQGEHGGLLLSDNARPLDGIQLGNDEPFMFPSFLKYLGPTRLLFHIESLGKDYAYDHSLFSGFKIQIRPLSALELGLGYSIIFGGDGAAEPDTLAGDFEDYFGFMPAIAATDNSFSNKILEWDFHVTIKEWRATQFYFEMLIDDKTYASWESTLSDRAGYRFGVYLPRLNSSGTMDFRLEGTYLGPILYRHGNFPYAQNGLILGDPLGPDGMGLDLTLGYDLNGKWRIENRLSLDSRDSNVYAGSGDTIDLVTDRPRETILLWRPSVEYRLNPYASFDLGLAYGRIVNAGYDSGRDENAFGVHTAIHVAFPMLSVH